MTDDSLVQCISEIRRLVGDEDHMIIQTLPKKSYRLNVTATEHCSPVEQPAKTSGSMLRLGAVAAVFAAVVLRWLFDGQDRSGTNFMADKPRTAVLPFDDFSAGKDKGYLSDAIAEAIITELARLSKAIELNPSASNFLVASTNPLLMRGQSDEAIERLEQAMGIDPFHPDWYHWQMAWALWEKDQCDDRLHPCSE